ncbi:MAG: DUF934 domain-containing protein [Pseudomonadales bacterium]
MPHDAERQSQLILNRTLVAGGDEWTLLDKDADTLPLGGAFIVAANLWNQFREQLLRQDKRAVWLDSNESPELIADDLQNIELIAINFPVFSDGRGFSYARTLREEYKYAGDIRAIGDVLPDQLAYMARCGFSSFELRGDKDAFDAISRFDDFSDAYQASQDRPLPLFARR